MAAQPLSGARDPQESLGLAFTRQNPFTPFEPPSRLLLSGLVPLLTWFVLHVDIVAPTMAAASGDFSVTASKLPLPGQIIRDPAQPQWLKRAGGEHIFLCGPGDPEDFFYRGTRLPDGTRDGDQGLLIDRLAQFGGNTLYVQAVRSHGGDGADDHNPFVDSKPARGLDEDILEQWDGWIARCADAQILVYFFLYDDSSLIWRTGNQVLQAEETFVQAIVDRFEHHPNIIWLIAEESEEALSDAKVRNLANLVAAADDHGHIIGTHHHSGTEFKAWEDGSALQHFSMQLNVPAGDVHAGALAARQQAEAAGAAGHGWFAMYTEAGFTLDADDVQRRHYLWNVAMAGVMPMVYGADIASTSDELLASCRIVQEFFEDSEFFSTESHDELARGGTRWVLADAPMNYISYADRDAGALGLGGLSAGHYELRWVDCASGARVTQRDMPFAAGSQLLHRPLGIGGECAVWARRQWLDLGQALAGTSGRPELDIDASMLPGEPFRLVLSQARTHAPLYTVAGTAVFGASFYGGVLVPAPDVVLPDVTNAAGSMSIVSLFPPGLPTGGEVYVQCWVVDPQGPAGFAASNALLGVVP